MLNIRMLTLVVAAIHGLPTLPVQADWLQFRGTNGNGSSNEQQLPVEWDAATGKGIAWTADLPGRGPASPIVVGDRVIVTCSSGYRQDRLHVVCFDADKGGKLWERQFWATGRTITHASSANAAPTPASDGRFIYAFFSSNDLICLNLEGELQWFRGLAHDFPQAGNDIGMSSSPVVIDDTVVVQVENQGDSFAAGIDTSNGETRWRAERQKAANWSSPLALRTPQGQSTVVMKSGEGITAYDPRVGNVLWMIKAVAGGIPSLIADGSHLYAPVDGLLALQLTAQEPVNLWTATDVQPGSASPTVHNGRLYCITRAGIVNCLDLEKGDRKWQLRLSQSGKKSSTFWASPVAAGDYLYCINQDGVAFVVRLTETGEIAAANEFGEGIQATPALAHQALFVRSDRHLWKVATP